MTRLNHRMARRRLAVLAVIVMGMAGCGPRSNLPPLGKVSGTVTIAGAPAVGIIVRFMPRGGGRGSIGVTNEQGRYTLSFISRDDGAIVGMHKVSFDREPAEGEGDRPLEKPSQSEDLGKTFEAEVKAGENGFDWDLGRRGT